MNVLASPKLGPRVLYSRVKGKVISVVFPLGAQTYQVQLLLIQNYGMRIYAFSFLHSHNTLSTFAEGDKGIAHEPDGDKSRAKGGGREQVTDIRTGGARGAIAPPNICNSRCVLTILWIRTKDMIRKDA